MSDNNDQNNQGSLIQLLNNNGVNDEILVNKPQITYHRVVFRKHTNFSMTHSQIPLLCGSSKVKKKQSIGVFRVPWTGDLLHKLYITCPSKGVQHVDKLIQNISFAIGGRIIDFHTGEWLKIDSELKHNECTKFMEGRLKNKPDVFHITIPFSFSKNTGLALPIIGIQKDKVDVIVTWGTEMDVGTEVECQIYGQYVMLETDERRSFAQTSHEYLIERCNCIIDLPVQSEFDLGHIHSSVKELIWTDSNSLTHETATISFGGQNIVAPKNKEFYQLLQPSHHHTNIPEVNKDPKNKLKINNYSFALTPENHQPSGHCNFADMKLKKTLKFSSEVKLNAIYNFSYAILKIQNGRATIPLESQQDYDKYYIPNHKHIKYIAKNIDQIAKQIRNGKKFIPILTKMNLNYDMRKYIIHNFL